MGENGFAENVGDNRKSISGPPANRHLIHIMSESSPKRILITGGVRRLGLHTALALAERGNILGLNYNTTPAQEAEDARNECLKRGAQAVFLLQGDLTKNAESIVERFAASAGCIDVVVNNAGVMPHRKTLDELSITQFQDTLAVNLVAPLAMTKYAVPYFPASGGAIVNLASLGGVQIWKSRIDYNVSKAALITLTEALARELASKHITVNAVAPGAIQIEGPDEHIGLAEDKIPLGRYGSPEDIVRAVLFFIYDAPYVTGQCLVVDGGRSVIG